MGRQNQLFGRAQQFLTRVHEAGGGVEAIGIQHRTARKAGEQLLHQRPRLGGAGRALGKIAQSRPDEQDGRLLPEDAGDALGEMPPSAPGSQGQRQHSGRRADTAASTGSTLASVTMPAPVRRAPSTVSDAAPR